ncbi:MAG: alpha-ketoglutarate-dependent dioxygenase AlkB family protein [Endozoicomonas sp.]
MTNATPSAIKILPWPDATVLFWPSIASESACRAWFTRLLSDTPWQQDSILLFGQTHPLPRLQAWFGDAGTDYHYSGLTLSPRPWTPALDEIRQRVEQTIHHPFNSVLLNLYRTGNDSNGWHSDDEPELGNQPVIASFSLGATRRFRMKHKTNPRMKTQSIDLPQGSLLLMKGDTQKYWSHCLAKTARIVGPRINLTFRTIHSSM